MSISLLTLISGAGGKASAPAFADRVSFAGEASYLAGGTTGLAARLHAQTGDSRAIVGIVSGDCGVYIAQYNPATDLLKVRKIVDGTEPADATDLSATTFNLVVLSG